MDLRRLRKGEWIAAISGAMLLVSLFLPWWSLPGSPGWDAWQVFSTADVLLALLGIGAIGAAAAVAHGRAVGPGIAAQALLTLLAIPMAVVAAIQVLGTPDSLEPALALVQVDTEYGAWLGLASTFGVLVGLMLGMRDERLSEPGRPTDQTGLPVDAPPPIETLRGTPPA